MMNVFLWGRRKKSLLLNGSACVQCHQTLWQLRQVSHETEVAILHHTTLVFATSCTKLEIEISRLQGKQSEWSRGRKAEHSKIYMCVIMQLNSQQCN